ncbi:sensor histidine kinase [Variovorax sp. MHTC-1]|uniref:sensor histidine kinase n=1 Tax=Variovorax sp. MHTC-1 TaxID=2495593 RepID=UPI000F86B763|nr:HAMP domain-containing histidine kinase [Variovorax sp. MHTC-1]RST55850.1 HAMP domain-containing histidine kinase [Variovorax sp. MHTC-1]
MALSPAVGVALGLSCLFVALPRVIARREARAARPVPVRSQPLERQRIDLRQLLEEMPRASSAALRTAGIELDRRLPDAALWVWADAGELRRMLTHIVRLACDAMPRGGVLKILARFEGAQAAVSFMDSSLASEQPRLASMFDRLSAARQKTDPADREIRESALASRRIADRHGGRLYAAPSSLGGLGLTLRMPLASLDAAPAAWGAVMMASDTRQPVLSEGLDARRILEAVLPYAAALFFFLALLAAALDERRCEDAADESVGTLAPVMSAGGASTRDTRLPNSSPFGFEHPPAAANCSGSSKPEQSE